MLKAILIDMKNFQRTVYINYFVMNNFAKAEGEGSVS